MGTNGHLYTYDMSQNAIFPGSVNAVGGLKINGTNAQKAISVNGTELVIPA